MPRIIRLAVIGSFISLISFCDSASAREVNIKGFQMWLAIEAPQMFWELPANERRQWGLVSLLAEGFKLSTGTPFSEATWNNLIVWKPSDLPQNYGGEYQ
jgi:hypothetical protein